QDWNDEPRSLTPPPLPPKPVALMDGLKRYPMLRSASASSFIDVDEYWAS
ncbi:15439_t:CDS:1, partial [Funneliformis geosporum]